VSRVAMPPTVAPVKRPEDIDTAVELWEAMSGNRADPASAEALKESGRTRVYRLRGAGPAGSAVIAKRRRAGGIGMELLWYRELARRVGVRSPELYGHFQDEAHEWLMLEDVGDEPYDVRSRAHRAALTTWLLAVHRDVALLGATSQLPEHGPERYRDHLRRARRLIDGNLDHPALTRPDVSFLAAVSETLGEVDGRWGDIESVCTGWPQTLVHGDLVGKNIRIRRANGVVEVVVLDWATGGWGIPAPDLSVSPLRSISPCPLLGRYGDAPERLGGLSSRRLRQLSVVGTAFRALAAMHWVSALLKTPYVKRPLRDLPTFQDALLQSLARLRIHGLQATR